MEEFINFFTSDIPQSIGIFLMTVVLIYLGYQANKHQKDLWYAIKGDDGKLQLLEVVMALWIILFPIIVLSNLFLERELDASIMISMDIILAIILGVKKFKDASSSVRSVTNSEGSGKKKEEDNPKQADLPPSDEETIV